MRSRKAISLLVTIICLIMVIAVSLKTYNERVSKNTEEYITQQLSTCTASEKKNKCLEKTASAFLDRYEFDQMLPILKKNEKGSVYFQTCHQLTHYLGQEAYKRMGTIGKVYVEADDTCLGGVYHGAVEGYFMEKELFIDGTAEMDQKIGEEVKPICGIPDDYPTPSQYSSCTHGLGHALMYMTANDLIKSFKLCDYQRDDASIQNCYAGALMQNYASMGSDIHPSVYALPDDPLYPCYILEKKYQRMCYTYGVQTNFQSDTKKSIDLCYSIPKEFQAECFNNYGNYRTMVTYSPSTIKEQCDLIGNEAYQASCIEGAAKAILFRFGLSSTSGNELCEFQPQGYKKACYTSVVHMAGSLTRKKSELLSYCTTIQDTYGKNYCQEKAQTLK